MLPRLRNNPYFPSWMDDFFSVSPWTDMESKVTVSMPAVNIKEDDHRFLLDLAAPGMEKKDFKLELNHNVLSISAEIEEEKEEKKKKYSRREFNYTSFKRSFTLPETVKQEGISASYEKGVLTIEIPKKVEMVEKAPKQIAIK